VLHISGVENQYGNAQFRREAVGIWFLGVSST
jgi:hypothetical protein